MNNLFQGLSAYYRLADAVTGLIYLNALPLWILGGGGVEACKRVDISFLGNAKAAAAIRADG